LDARGGKRGAKKTHARRDGEEEAGQRGRAYMTSSEGRGTARKGLIATSGVPWRLLSAMKKEGKGGDTDRLLPLGLNRGGEGDEVHISYLPKKEGEGRTGKR